MGKSDKSERNLIFHYYESKLMAVRMAPWKFHFFTKEAHYDSIQPGTAPLVFNIRTAPYESYDTTSRDFRILGIVAIVMAILPPVLVLRFHMPDKNLASTA